MLDILIQYHRGFLSGAWVSIQLALIAWLLGLSLGSWLGYLAYSRGGLFKLTLSGVNFFLVSIPVIVLLFWVHYPLQTMLGLVIDPFYSSAFIFALLNTLMVAEIVRSALVNFPQQYLNVANVYGLQPKQTWWHIRLPLMLRHILPALITAQVVIFQSTLFAGLISAEEILRVSQRINATAYKPVEIYSVVALFFLVICGLLNWLAAFFKKRYQRDLSEF